MTQVSLNPWLLLGHRYDDDGAPNPYTSRSLKQRSEDRKSSPYSNAANHAAPDNDGHGGDENGDEDISDDEPHTTGGGTRLRQRTRIPWLELDK